MTTIVFSVKFNYKVRSEPRVVRNTCFLIWQFSQVFVVDAVDISQVKCCQHHPYRCVMGTVKN